MSANLIVISSPVRIPSEISKVVALFKAGLQQFHVRKPGFTDFDMINYIGSIPKEFRPKVVLHSHYYLAKEYGMLGIQVGKNRIEEAAHYKNDFKYFGYSAHSFNEILEKQDVYSHFFLSPIFDSISKEGYKASFDLEEVSDFIQDNSSLKIIALGGINPDNYMHCQQMGFCGAAVLGAIWQEEDVKYAFEKFQEDSESPTYVLSIAGFDPSSGAGITADIKTFEQHRVIGLGVTTSITYQSEDEFVGVDWLSFDQIKRQIEVLFKKYRPAYIKVGLIENFEILNRIIGLLKDLNNEIKIIWDPILKASANFGFHQDIKKEEIIDLLKDVELVTPNLPECEAIFGTSNTEEIQKLIQEYAIGKVLVKGGHSEGDDVNDVLVELSGISQFEGKRLFNKDKHGTGCVLSSSICANMARGIPLNNAIKKAKAYVTQFIDSNNGMLGFHHNKE